MQSYMASSKVSTNNVRKRAEKYAAWTLSSKEDALTQTFHFPTAVSALAFAAKVTVHAELLQHHPVIELFADTVKIKLHSKEAKGLTTKDFELAKRIDKLSV